MINEYLSKLGLITKWPSYHASYKDQRAAGVNTEHHEPPSYFTNSLWTTRIRKEGTRCLPHCFIALYVSIGLSSFLLSCVSSHLTSVTPSDIHCLISFTRYSWRYLSLVCLVTCLSISHGVKNWLRQINLINHNCSVMWGRGVNEDSPVCVHM